MNRRITVGVVVAIGMMCGTSSQASIWFTGYQNPSNNYRYYAFTDWDTPLFGSGIQPDTDLYGMSPPSYKVDGHVIFEALGDGSAKVIESTGSYASSSLFVGAVMPVSFQFSGWWNYNSIAQATSDTRADYNADFLNVVSGRIDSNGVVPEAASLAIWSIGGVVLLAVVAVRKRWEQDRGHLVSLGTEPN